jgi:hypothetical protein
MSTYGGSLVAFYEAFLLNIKIYRDTISDLWWSLWSVFTQRPKTIIAF